LHLELGVYGVERLHHESNIISTERFRTIEDLESLFAQDATVIPPDVTFTYVSPLGLGGAGRPATARVTVDGPVELRNFHRPGPSYHDDPDGAGLFAQLGAATVPHAPPFVLEADNLQQVGYRGYLTPDGEFFTDEALVNAAEEHSFLARLSQGTPFLNEDTGLTPASLPGTFNLDARNRAVKHVDGEVVSLCSFEPTNYGAFLFRTLPKLADRHGIIGPRKVIAPLYYQAMRDLFAMAGLPVDQIIPHDSQVIYHYKKAIIPSLRNTHALLDEATRTFYGGLRDRYGSRAGRRKLYISRRRWSGSFAASHRVMLNEEELAARLAREGFEIIAPQAMSSKQQIEAFSSADVIVGASGSAMFNVVFCHPGTRLLDIESEPHWIFAHANLFGSCGLEYGIVEAQAQDRDWSVPHKPFTVNVDAVMARVAHF
jgi:hypothetical protein